MANGKGAAKKKRLRSSSGRIAGKLQLRDELTLAVNPEQTSQLGLGGLVEQDLRNKMAEDQELSRKGAQIVMSALLNEADTSAEVTVFEDPNSPLAKKIVSEWVAAGEHTPSSISGIDSVLEKATMVATEEYGMSLSDVLPNSTPAAFVMRKG